MQKKYRFRKATLAFFSDTIVFVVSCILHELGTLFEHALSGTLFRLGDPDPTAVLVHYIWYSIFGTLFLVPYFWYAILVPYFWYGTPLRQPPPPRQFWYAILVRYFWYAIFGTLLWYAILVHYFDSLFLGTQF